jgi:hypothetical protein
LEAATKIGLQEDSLDNHLKAMAVFSEMLMLQMGNRSSGKISIAQA